MINYITLWGHKVGQNLVDESFQRDQVCTFVTRFTPPRVTRFAAHSTKTLPRSAFFSCCGLGQIWGRKRREKKRRKVRAASTLAKMQRIITILSNRWLLYYHLKLKESHSRLISKQESIRRVCILFCIQEGARLKGSKA